VLLSWVLIVDQAHPHDVLDRESACFAVSVVVDKLKHLQVGILLTDKVFHRVVVHFVLEDTVGYEHLCHSDGAPPADIIVVAYFQLASLALVQTRKRQECFYLLQVGLEQWLEISFVTEPR